LVVHGALKLC